MTGFVVQGHILTGANTKSFTGAPLSREDMYNS